MNKKGFTLVELLAVIAILAILVIIALPNVLEMYRTSRKNTFQREVASVYDAAKTKYFLNAFEGQTATKIYTNVSGVTGAETLSLQGGNKDFTYCIILDSTGKATKLEVTNGSYKYVNPTGGIDDVKNVSTGTITDDTTKLSACAAS